MGAAALRGRDLPHTGRAGEEADAVPPASTCRGVREERVVTTHLLAVAVVAGWQATSLLNDQVMRHDDMDEAAKHLLSTKLLTNHLTVSGEPRAMHGTGAGRRAESCACLPPAAVGVGLQLSETRNLLETVYDDDHSIVQHFREVGAPS